MRIHISGRQTGKTYKLMWWLNEGNNRILIVHSGQEAARLKKDYPHLENQIIPVESVQSGRLRGMRNIEVAIDNLDLILPGLLGLYNGEIGPVSYTGDFSYGS